MIRQITDQPSLVVLLFVCLGTAILLFGSGHPRLVKVTVYVMLGLLLLTAVLYVVSLLR